MDLWVQLTTSSGAGPPKSAGEIHCVISFEGPLGVAYPQHQPGVDSFDDSMRVNLKGYLDETKEEGRGGAEMDGGDGELGGAIVRYQGGEPLQRSSEFTDDEISSAFKFLDLDHNLHIGAAEIRHILICMGELITDEEVDMMITMVDSDGDGQVSYDEFHRLVVDPDPSRAEFGAEPVKSPSNDAAAVTQEMKDRETKRWLLEEFVNENEFRSVELEMAYKRFRNMAPVGGGGGNAPGTSSAYMDFNTWILVFNVEATGQYRKLFKLYADGVKEAGAGGGAKTEGEAEKVDIREFFLGMANFVEWPLEQRTQFIFMLFDEDRSGFLSMEELVAVLKANHLSTAKAVAKKAQTIMRQADADNSGSLTLDEFLVVAKKFPNLLFPAKKKPDAAEKKVPLLGS